MWRLLYTREYGYDYNDNGRRMYIPRRWYSWIAGLFGYIAETLICPAYEDYKGVWCEGKEKEVDIGKYLFGTDERDENGFHDIWKNENE